MNNTRFWATAQLLLISPAVVFMCSLIVRHLQPLHNEPAHTAHQIVMWYAGRMWSLWVLLVGLPLSVLVTGCLSLVRRRISLRPAQQAIGGIHTEWPVLCTFVTTIGAAVILTIVVLHMLAN